PISVAGATGMVREVVTVGVADPNVRLRMPRTAEVTVQILPGSTIRTLSGVSAEVRNLDNGLRGRLTPSEVSVTVRGTAKDVGELAPEALSAWVDAAGLPPGDHEVEVKLQPPPGIEVEQVSPNRVRLRITRS